MNRRPIVVSSLGGSGEDCRSCFLVEYPGGSILLDCGVRREVGIPLEQVYPALTKEMVSGLKGVFLSHAHEDHTAALPLLYRLGYRGPVYATAAAIEQVPGFLKKWMNYVKNRGGVLPFGEEDPTRIAFTPLPLGSRELDGIQVTLGRSGHMVGSVWIHFRFGEKTLLYTGDMAPEGLLLAADAPPPADLAVLECAYAGKRLIQEEQYQALLRSVKDTLAKGGKVLLPVPPKGRGADLALFLCGQLPDAAVYAEPEVAAAAGTLLDQTAWLRDNVGEGAGRKSLRVVSGNAGREAAAAGSGGAVCLAPDGMLSSGSGLYYYERLKGDPRNKVILTGHAAKGTVGERLFDPAFCAQDGVMMEVQKITIKVHLDEEDALALVRQVGAGKVLLFHAGAADCAGLLERLRDRGVEAACRLTPGKMEL